MTDFERAQAAGFIDPTPALWGEEERKKTKFPISDVFVWLFRNLHPSTFELLPGAVATSKWHNQEAISFSFLEPYRWERGFWRIAQRF